MNRDKQKVFMVKRTNRTYLDDTWGFGGSRLTSDKTYKEEFNIAIDFIEDRSPLQHSY